eukprot:XP_001692688.1 predicted protein [Chlamydomonas reinhardtii]
MQHVLIQLYGLRRAKTQLCSGCCLCLLPSTRVKKAGARRSSQVAGPRCNASKLAMPVCTCGATVAALKPASSRA